MFLKHVITHCRVLFDQTENNVEEPVQQQHFTLTFIYVENVVRLKLKICCLIVIAKNLI